MNTGLWIAVAVVVLIALAVAFVVVRMRQRSGTILAARSTRATGGPRSGGEP